MRRAGARGYHHHRTPRVLPDPFRAGIRPGLSRPHLGLAGLCWPDCAGRIGASSTGAHESSLQILIDGCLRHPEGTTYPDRLQFTGVHQAIHGHL